MSVWALVDARDEGQGDVRAVDRVAGIPLVTRHARLAARLGWRGAVFRVRDEAQAADVARALAAYPAPPSLEIDVTSGVPTDRSMGGCEPSPPPRPAEPVGAPRAPRSYVALDARGIYADTALREAAAGGTTPEPLVTVRTREDARAAQRLLMARLRKSIDQDGVISYYFMRPVSRSISRILVHTRVTPNQVTLVAMACGIAAAIAATRGGWLATAIAGALLWLGAAIDCVDGELARLRLQGSKLGEWLDTIADDVSSFGVLVGVGVGLASDGAGEAWLWASAIGAAVGFATQAKLYADLHRLRLPIDTSQYPWFFGKASSGESKGKGTIGTIVYVIAFVFRRDFFVTILSALFIADLRRVAVVILLGGVAIMLALLAVHLTIMAIRRARS